MDWIVALLLFPVVAAMLWLVPAAFVWLVTRRPQAGERWLGRSLFVATRLALAAALLGLCYLFSADLGLWVTFVGALMLVIAIPGCLLLALARALLLREGSPYTKFVEEARPVATMIALLAMLSVPIVAHWRQEKARRASFGYAARFDRFL